MANFHTFRNVCYRGFSILLEVFKMNKKMKPPMKNIIERRFFSMRKCPEIHLFGMRMKGLTGQMRGVEGEGHFAGVEANPQVAVAAAAAAAAALVFQATRNHKFV
ncbi:unnamed protein product [Gongylonema pulchrum]|uniref:Uncharacterized protein n=1 Tax=Gongylonema pulchrum TaxID=637853 RepID=A0A183E6U0_9BILA|nr:unnamed protein product [Gongylonema pulchrum]